VTAQWLILAVQLLGVDVSLRAFQRAKTEPMREHWRWNAKFWAGASYVTLFFMALT
jgi:hypothetical protein